MVARPTTRINVQPRSSVRVGTIPKFPAQVVAGDGIAVEEEGGVYTFSAPGVAAAAASAADAAESAAEAAAMLVDGTDGYALIGNGASPSTYQGYLQAGTGAVTRTWREKNRDALNAADFGVVCDGVALNAAALNAAFTAGGTYGKKVIIPPGVCLVESALTVTGAGSVCCDIEGSGNGATKIRSTFATGDVLTYNITNGTIRNIRFESTVTRTTGATIKLLPNGATVQDVTICAPYIGIHNTGIVNRIIGCNIGAAADAALSNLGPITSRATASGSCGIYNEGGQLQVSQSVISGGTLTKADMPSYCIRNRGETDVINSYLFLANKGYFSDPINGTGGIGSVIGCWIDSVLDTCIEINSSSGANENEHMIAGNWLACGFDGATATAAILLRGENSRYVTISNNIIVGYNSGVGQGVWLDQTPSVGVNAVGVTITGNDIGLASGLGWANGVFTSANVKSFAVVGNNFKGNSGAVTISAGNDDYVVTGNNFEGNTISVSGNSSSITKKVGMNTGINIIAAGGPTGSATSIPIITYDTEGRLTAVSSATPTPAIANVTGLGTGVATALAVSTGSAGAFALLDTAAWSTHTATVTLAVGGPPTVTKDVRYKQLPGKVVAIRGTIVISNLNGGSGNVIVTLPVAESGATGNVTPLTGYNATTAAQFPCVINGGASSITFVVTAGLESYNFSGIYQGA